MEQGAVSIPGARSGRRGGLEQGSGGDRRGVAVKSQGLEVRRGEAVWQGTEQEWQESMGGKVIIWMSK
jgi:hypothetical protein